jgi:hypothetical protein
VLPIPNASGLAATFSTQDRIPLSGPFFQASAPMAARA